MYTITPNVNMAKTAALVTAAALVAALSMLAATSIVFGAPPGQNPFGNMGQCQNTLQEPPFSLTHEQAHDLCQAFFTNKA